MFALACDALAHGAAEGGLRPVTDAGILIGCDVAAVDSAERRFDRITPAKGWPPDWVWQTAQLPIATSAAPLATTAGS